MKTSNVNIVGGGIFSYEAPTLETTDVRVEQGFIGSADVDLPGAGGSWEKDPDESDIW